MRCVLLFFFAGSYCFTTTIVILLRVVVALCCVGIVFSMFACLLDLCGTMNRCLKAVKDYSIGNVITGEVPFMSAILSHLKGYNISNNDNKSLSYTLYLLCGSPNFLSENHSV